jgi:hypothetical protein
VILAGTGLLAGCTTSVHSQRDDTAVPYPAGCAYDHLTMRQCDAFIGRVADEHRINLASASKVLLLGDPGCGPDAPAGEICMRSSGFDARVQIVMPDGSVIEESKFCGVGGAAGPRVHRPARAAVRDHRRRLLRRPGRCACAPDP